MMTMMVVTKFIMKQEEINLLIGNFRREHNIMAKLLHSYCASCYYQSFFHQLMHNRIALKGVLKFTSKQLQHVSLQPPSSGRALFEFAKVTVVKIVN